MLRDSAPPAGRVLLGGCASHYPARRLAGNAAQTDTAGAARVVLDCVLRFGAGRSNPVLEVLRDVPDLVQGRKYPQPPLEFAAGRGRAYYHSRPRTAADAEEHGHFHLFVPQGRARDKPGWAHLAALAMDRDGQPVRWFATNRWVTGGGWGERDWLLARVDALTPEREPAGIQQWLAAMLRLYRTELEALLTARDAHCADRPGRSCGQAIWDGRCLYELAQVPVDLVAKLSSELTGENP